MHRRRTTMGAMAGVWVAVVAAIADLVLVFDWPTGRFRQARRLEGGPAGRPHLEGARLWLPARNLWSRTGLTRLDLASAAPPERLLPFPVSFEGSPLLAERYSWVAFTLLGGDTLAATFNGTSSELYLADRADRVRDTIPIPEARRRGIPPDLGARLEAARSQVEHFALSSHVFQVERTAAGDLAVLHLDQDLQLQPTLITATGYVSLLSADLTRACVDARLDLAQDNMARATIVGDSVFSVEQAIVGLEARTYVKHHVIDRSTCDWIPAGHGRR